MQKMAASTVQRISIKDAPKVGDPTYTFHVEIDAKACTGCGICVIQCPSRILEMTAHALPRVNIPACTSTCPIGNNVSEAMHAVSENGSFEQAWRIIAKTNPMPAVTGRVCHHPCETRCNRSHLDDPVNVNQFERFIGDYGLAKNLAFEKVPAKNSHSVAVVGSGPSGMSCAYHLAMAGYKVRVFEANEKAGGMLRYAIPAYRLPEEVLDGELQRIFDIGVDITCSTSLGENLDLNTLRNDFDAVYLALGAQGNLALDVEGVGQGNTLSALNFLRHIRSGVPVEIRRNVLVVGGGNVAIDVARSALRSGAKAVTMVCLEQLGEMPASDSEIREAIAEGIDVVNGYGPCGVLARKGRVKDVEFKRCTSVFDANGCFLPEYDEDDRMKKSTDTLIIAAGQRPDLRFLADNYGMNLSKSGHIEVTGYHATSMAGVFAGGDAVSLGKGTVSGAIGMGLSAARAIDAYLQGISHTLQYDGLSPQGRLASDRYHLTLPRNNASTHPPAERCSSWQEVNLPLHENQVESEARRCLACGTGEAAYTGPQCADAFNIACHNCHNCVAICPEKAVSFGYYTKR